MFTCDTLFGLKNLFHSESLVQLEARHYFEQVTNVTGNYSDTM